MATVQQELELSFTDNLIPTVVHIKQYDTSARQLVCTLYQGSLQIYLDSTMTVTVSGTRPDGYFFSYNTAVDPTVVKISSGKLLFSITEVISAVAGKIAVDVTLNTGTGIVGAFAFTIRVQKTPIASASEETEDEEDSKETINGVLSDIYIDDDGHLIIETNDALCVVSSMDETGVLSIDY